MPAYIGYVGKACLMFGLASTQSVLNVYYLSLTLDREDAAIYTKDAVTFPLRYSLSFSLLVIAFALFIVSRYVSNKIPYYSVSFFYLFKKGKKHALVHFWVGVPLQTNFPSSLNKEFQIFNIKHGKKTRLSKWFPGYGKSIVLTFVNIFVRQGSFCLYVLTNWNISFYWCSLMILWVVASYLGLEQFKLDARVCWEHFIQYFS